MLSSLFYLPFSVYNPTQHIFLSTNNNYWKVGSSGLSGKEAIVLNGLASARKGIDDFVSLFPKEDVSAVIAKIEAENELNRQEFDKELGQILNPKPVADKQSWADRW